MIRKATIKDIKPIHELLQLYGEQGKLLARPLSELYDHVRDFYVHWKDGGDTLQGCCALQFCWEDLAEIRSLAVSPEFTGQGIGSDLTRQALQEAAAFDVRQIFTLTYEPDFFRRFGFKTIDRSELPLKIWADCIICVKFPDCDETAMVKTL
jgi:amino-acid N-acetyltransferase